MDTLVGLLGRQVAQLLSAESGQLHLGRTHEDVTSGLQVEHIDAVARVVDHRTESFLALAQGLFGVSQLGDILNGDGAADDAAFSVANGHGAVQNEAASAVETLNLQHLPEYRLAILHGLRGSPFVRFDGLARIGPPRLVLHVIIHPTRDRTGSPYLLIHAVGEKDAALGIGDDHADGQCFKHGLQVALLGFRLQLG